VSRRYRNFEVLHRQLRAYAAYRLKLPPKRIFIHSNNVEFVEERRDALDRYLQALLAHEQLRHCPDLYEFLRAGSQLYELASPQPQPLQKQPPRRAPSSQKSESASQQRQQQRQRPQQQQSQSARQENQQQQAQQPSRSQQQQSAEEQRQEEEQQGDQRERGRQQRGVLSGLSRAVLDSTHSMGRGLSSATGAVADLASAASGGVAKAANGVADAAGAVVGAFTGPPQGSEGTELRSGLTRRVRSVPTALNQAGSDGSEGAVPMPRGHSGTALKGSGLLSKASMRLRQAMQREASAPQAQQLELSGHSGSSSSTVGSEHSTAAAAQQGAVAGPVAALLQRDSSGSLSGSPTKRASKLFGSLRRKSRSISPSKEPRQRRERSPSRWSRRGDGSGSAAPSRRNSGELPAGDSSPGMPPLLLSSLAPPSPLGANPPSPLVSFPVEPTLDPDDCAGISAPLYEMVDCLFQLQTRGFFRRQVFAVARQALSLVAGEAIDSYLISQLARLRDQYTVGRIIASIQASLWPGGVFFWYTPTGRTQQAAAAAWRAAQAAATQEAASGGSGAAAADGGGHTRPTPMQPERFLEPGGPPPLDADEIREAVEAALLRRAPTTLVRLIGKNAYASGMRDLFDMLQSPAFCQQLGYGVLEIAVVHLFPELKPLFRTLQHGGLG
jgi:sorting nexin-13